MDKISRREGEVLERLAEGQSNKTIALEMGLSVDTIKQHTQRIYAKAGVPHWANPRAWIAIHAPELLEAREKVSHSA